LSAPTTSPDRVRVAAVQYALKPIAAFDDFAAQCAHYVAAAAEWNVDVCLFPEFLTTQLLTIPGSASVGDLDRHTPAYLALFLGLARSHRMAIVAGTHVHARGNKLFNAAHVFHPEGRIDIQDKLHLTPWEVAPWRISPGERLTLVDFPFGKAATPICYDVEFPELIRQARARGADILFVPSCTDDAQGFWRVRHCAQARAIEDQIYVVVTHTVGAIPIDGMRSNAGCASILSPCDVGFPRAGVLAEGEMNHDQIVVAELDMALLRRAREHGSVRTWQDRRGDLYPLAG
jgi:predicted amidohydrolase